MSTITVSVRVPLADETVAGRLAAALNTELQLLGKDGSIRTTEVSTDPDSGAKVKTTKTERVYTEPVEDAFDAALDSEVG